MARRRQGLSKSITFSEVAGTKETSVQMERSERLFCGFPGVRGSLVVAPGLSSLSPPSPSRNKYSSMGGSVIYTTGLHHDEEACAAATAAAVFYGCSLCVFKPLTLLQGSKGSSGGGRARRHTLTHIHTLTLTHTQAHMEGQPPSLRHTADKLTAKAGSQCRAALGSLLLPLHFAHPAPLQLL